MMKQVLTVLDYLRDETALFSQKPFCLLDAFVLGIASYFMFENTPEIHSSILGDTLELPPAGGVEEGFGEETQDTAGLHSKHAKNPSFSQADTHSDASGSSYTEAEQYNARAHSATLSHSQQADLAYLFSQPVLASAALECIPEQNLSNLSWFNAVAPAFKKALVQSPRFAALGISDVCSCLDAAAYTQFAAVCFHVPDGSFYLSFRGTDSTLTGWEEDFALSVLNPVSSQYDALVYTCDMLEKWGGLTPVPSNVARNEKLAEQPGKAPDKTPAFYLGGHSKGGNLAVYAALHCPEELQNYITHIYNFDGPGVNPWQYGTQPVERIRKRTTKVIPSNSVVGRIFQDVTVPLIVESSEVGLMQHMPFSWKLTKNKESIADVASDMSMGASAVGVSRAGDVSVSSQQESSACCPRLDAETYTFVFDASNTALSDSLNEGFSAWLAGLSFNERVEFCAILFGIVEYVSDDNNIETLPASLLKKLPDVVRHLALLDKETRHFAWQTISSLLENLVHAVF